MTAREVLKVQRELDAMVRLCAEQVKKIRKLEARVRYLEGKLTKHDAGDNNSRG